MIKPGSLALTILLGLLSAIGPFSTDMYVPSLPGISAAFGATTQQVQLTISSYLVGFALGQIVYGPLSDRYGRKPVLVAAVLLYCITTLLCTVSTSIEMLIVLRLFQAFGGCGAIVLARAIVRDLYAGARAGREMAIIAVVMGLAPLVAPLIGGVLETYFDWRANFIAMAIVGLECVALVWWYLPETLKTRAAEPVSLPSVLRSYRIILRDRSYLAHLGIVACAYAGLFAWISGATFLLQNLYELTAMAFAGAFAAGSIGFLLGTTVAARLVVRLGLGRIIGLGCGALAMGGVAMASFTALGMDTAFTIVLSAAIYLFGLGLALPQATAAALTPFPERAGAASSLLGFLQQSAASACGALVGAWLGASAWPIAAPMALLGMAALAIWLMTRTSRATIMH
ncbi:MAG TPA: multidrug effflux MFS transporter [Pseudolabrys sp.]|nr:multidrug effflux MFS transporter [Pseudolabrys sp.]